MAMDFFIRDLKPFMAASGKAPARTRILRIILGNAGRSIKN